MIAAIMSMIIITINRSCSVRNRFRLPSRQFTTSAHDRTMSAAEPTSPKARKARAGGTAATAQRAASAAARAEWRTMAE
jgi:hypothetical protein